MLVFLHIPMFVLLVAICNIPPVWAGIHGIFGPLASYALLAFLFLGPAGYYLVHSHHVGRVVAAIEATLAQRSRIDAPATPLWAVPLWLNILCLILVGPHLIFALIGQLQPSFFNNTPLSGSHLDPLAIVGFIVITARFAWHRIVAAQEPSRP